MIHVVVFVKSIIINHFIADTLSKSAITKFLLFPFFCWDFSFFGFPHFSPLFVLFFLLFVPDGFLCPTSGTSHEGPEVPCPSSVPTRTYFLNNTD